MSLAAFTHGLVLSFGLIVAFGPQNVFIFQQGATQPRFRQAVPTVVTAGVADTLLVLLAVLGVSVVVLEFAWLQTALFAAGFVFLCYVGWVLYVAPDFEPDATGADRLGTREQVGFTASVSILNPHAILDTVGVIGTNALAYAGANRWSFTAGCLIVSWGWFTGLAIVGRRLGGAAPGWLRHLNTVSAALVWLAALYMGIQLVDLVV